MKEEGITKPQVIVFDVYKTLINIEEMEGKVNQVVDSKRGYTIWFELLCQYCFADNSLDTYQDFISIAKASLQMTGQQLGRPVTDADAEDVIALLTHLPIHEEVQESLSQLSDK